MTSNQFTSKNIFKFIFFLTFVDLLLFSITRLSLKLGLSDINYHPYFISDFSLANYFIFILCCFGVFVLTISLTFLAPKNIFKIHISRNTFFLLLMILLISSIYLFFVQQTLRPRYTSGSIMTLAGLTRVINTALLLCLFIIYQLNRKQINYKNFIIILASSILVIDGVGGGAIFLSLKCDEKDIACQQKIFIKDSHNYWRAAAPNTDNPTYTDSEGFRCVINGKQNLAPIIKKFGA